MLLNKAANLLDIIVWQNSNIGVKKSKQTRRPEPFMPEFMKQPIQKDKEIEVHTTTDIRDILNQPRG